MSPMSEMWKKLKIVTRFSQNEPSYQILLKSLTRLSCRAQHRRQYYPHPPKKTLSNLGDLNKDIKRLNVYKKHCFKWQQIVNL